MTRSTRSTALALAVPDDFLIPAAPSFRWIPAARPAPWWREAMRWALIGLTASWAAGEITLWLAFG
jgi:hypothetical protein